MLPRQAVLKIIVIFFIFIGVVNADAIVYKWEDDSGNTIFTNDPTKVPEAFRKNPFYKDPITLKETLEPVKNELQGEEGIFSDNKETEGNESKKDSIQEELTVEQLSIVEAVVNFLKEDILRYEKYYTYPPSRSKFRIIKLAVAGSTVHKKRVLELVSQHDLPFLSLVSEFLKTSIAADEKSQKIMPTTIVSTRQTQTLINRLKTESKQEAKLLRSIVSFLKAKQ